MSRNVAFGFALAAALAAGSVATAAPAPAKAQFPKVPAQALTTLKGERGKPVKDGLVFINGHYVEPPYTVMRYGNSIRINDIPATGQIISWNTFLSTQDENNVEKRTIGGGEAPAPGDTPPPGGAPAPAKDSGDDLFDDDFAFSRPAAVPGLQVAGWSLPLSDALDDLFGDDDITPAKPTPSRPSAVRRPAAPPPPPKPVTVYTLKPGCVFDMNPRARELLKNVSKVRADIDMNLRSGGLCIFSSRHPRKLLSARLAQELMDVLPEALRDATSAAQLEGTLRAKGIHYIDSTIAQQLFANRTDYFALQNRRTAMREARKLNNIMNGRRY